MRVVPGDSFCGNFLGAVTVYPASQNGMKSNSARTLFSPLQSGTDLFPRFNRILPTTIYTFAPATMSLCGRIVNNSGNGEGGPPAQTPSADQQHTDYEGSIIG